jgi:hypothetical protein
MRGVLATCVDEQVAIDVDVLGVGMLGRPCVLGRTSFFEGFGQLSGTEI